MIYWISPDITLTLGPFSDSITMLRDLKKEMFMIHSQLLQSIAIFDKVTESVKFHYANRIPQYRPCPMRKTAAAHVEFHALTEHAPGDRNGNAFCNRSTAKADSAHLSISLRRRCFGIRYIHVLEVFLEANFWNGRWIISFVPCVPGDAMHCIPKSRYPVLGVPHFTILLEPLQRILMILFADNLTFSWTFLPRTCNCNGAETEIKGARWTWYISVWGSAHEDIVGKSYVHPWSQNESEEVLEGVVFGLIWGRIPLIYTVTPMKRITIVPILICELAHETVEMLWSCNL
jgi:hypothetical protein